ncbi:SusC/RagA family TonB-linked outer membrane protein [Prevotella sp. 10(H)]|uniref:SusC/RagA family TonB-linked outer membrane protein n=1 Tax=Prevotella sp. 10(H) TaxID=1158294 RepID=UPI0004A7747D|nr:SusC/RagA family TonB-linked outer membrane protein [Prevotella sp. 10(H)]
MKLLCFFLSFFALMSYATNSYAQKTSLSLKMENVKVQDVLNQIESETKMTFFYDNQIDVKRVVSVNVHNKNVFQILNEVFAGTDVTYKILDKNIILSKKGILDKAEQDAFVQYARKITGLVVDEAGEAIIGANVTVEGQKIGNITNIDGQFTLNVPEGATLIISYIGYTTQTIKVTAQDYYKIVLKENPKLLDEVVVTALGIKREEKALGYSVQKVKGEDLTNVKGVNFATSLTGKVAGLNVKNSTEFAAAPSIELRGYSPLIVVDGVPFYNISLSDIAADDIESIDILKGATASALYGSKGASGAVMVTTKNGKNSKEGLNISVNSNTMFHAGYLKFPEVQTSYSSGSGGRYAPGDYVWGDKLDIGRTAKQYNPYTYELEEMELVSKGKDNIKNFTEAAFVTNNNISVTQKGKYGNFRTSLTHVYNKGQFPNAKQNKFTFSVAGNLEWQKLSMDAGITYNKRYHTNTNGTGYGKGSYLYNLMLWTGAEYDIRDYKNYWKEGKTDVEQNWMDPDWYDNPYFLAHERVNPSHYDYTNSYANVSYDFTKWFKLVTRVGVDMYRNRVESRQALSSRAKKEGSYSITNNTGYSVNGDMIAMVNRNVGDFNIDSFFGGAINFYEQDGHFSSTENGLMLPGYYSLKSSIDPASTSSSVKKRQINSFYGKVGGSWKSRVFLEFTGRNDWVSTLDESEQSFFYPSVSGSVIMSEFLPMPKWADFWKIRASWSQTKHPAEVYEINQTYSISDKYWGLQKAAFYPKSIRDVTLRPKSTEAFELGTSMHFFDNRLKFDFAYYRKKEYDLQTHARMSSATGFGSTLINYGEEQLSRGFEVAISGDIIKTKDWTWNSGINWALDRYYYHKVDEEYSTKKPWVHDGASWWWLDMYEWERDPDGNIIHYNGMPKVSDYPSFAGHTNPDWIFGWSNSVKFKNFRFNMSIDGRIGGVMFNYMDQRLWHAGRHIDSDNQWRYDEVVNGMKNYIGQGVKIDSGTVEYDSDGNITKDTRVFVPNDVEVSYETYMRNYYMSNRRNILDKKTFFKLRELSIGYSLPASICEKVKLKGADISLVGQNLLIWTKDFRFSDPDRDTEDINSPSIRYVGFNVQLNF